MKSRARVKPKSFTPILSFLFSGALSLSKNIQSNYEYDRKLFVKMPNKNFIINNTLETKTLRRSPRFSTRNPPPQQLPIPSTRRSLRFLQKNETLAQKVQNNVSLQTPKSVLEKIPKRSSKPSEENNVLNVGSKRTPVSDTGFGGIRILRRSPRLSFVRKIDDELEDCNKAKGSKDSKSDLKNFSPGLRRSPRLNNEVRGHQIIGKARGFSCRISRDREKTRRNDDKGNLFHVHNAGISESSCGKSVANGESKLGNSSVPEAVAAKSEEAHVVDGVVKKKTVVRRKRKRDNDGIGSGIGVAQGQGWTKEQEAALQRAYYVAKPTPQFWKKVSKLVPGKSAQDCFDKVHSDHMTPPQSRPRSRAQATKSSQMERLLLSEGDLLNLDDAKSRKLRSTKRRSHIAQKTVRYLLQKNYLGAQNSEADLFSLLEPNISLSYQSPKPSRVLSSPKNLQGNQGFNICFERSSNHKKPLSRFSSSVENIVVSPPVLKQVKNKALHEKYIDQLHCREAKRKAASRHPKNCNSEDKVINDVHAVRTDNLRAAKNALISDAREAINQLQHLNANAMSKSSDFDGDDYYHNLDNDDEDET